MYISQIDIKDIIDVSRIGKLSLPISYSSNQLLELLNDTSYIILKAVDDDLHKNKIVGYAILKEYSSVGEINDNSKLENNYNDNDNSTDNNNDKHIHIMSIAVEPEYRVKNMAHI